MSLPYLSFWFGQQICLALWPGPAILGSNYGHAFFQSSLTHTVRPAAGNTVGLLSVNAVLIFAPSVLLQQSTIVL